MTAVANKAIFLSYASQDAEAARRICEALRTAGVEVWFDQSELRGGDAWDAKIRRQIKECALFVPVISANTQARREGYFRLEWWLAEQRTHLLSHDTAFVIPVVIDDTGEQDARVPEAFLCVQWTRLPQGETPRVFCDRIKALLATGDEVSAGSRPAADRTGQGASAVPPPATRSSRAKIILIPAVMILVAGGGVAIKLLKGDQKDHGAKPAAAAPLSEARQLVEKARAVFEAGDLVNRETYILAEALLKKAEELDVTEAEAWALHAAVSRWMDWFGLDTSIERREAMRLQAERAIKLAPASVSARLAYATMLLEYPGSTTDEAEKILKSLLAEYPDDWRVLLAGGLLHRRKHQMAEAIEMLLRARWLSDDHQAVTGDLLTALVIEGRYAEAEAIVAESLARKSNGRLLEFDVRLKLNWRGDAPGAAAALERWPAWMFNEDRSVQCAAQVWMWNRDAGKALPVLARFPRDTIRHSRFTGPRAALTAWLHEQAGNTQAAQADWRRTIQVADRELSLAPSAREALDALHWKAWALARLGDRAAAEMILRELIERKVDPFRWNESIVGLVALGLVVGDTDWALEELKNIFSETGRRTTLGFVATRAVLDLNPCFDGVRTDPRFLAIRATAPSPESNKTQGPSGPTPVAKSVAISEKSILVLPLENLSPDPANAFFTDGIQAEIIATLQRIPELKVISRDSAMALKGSTAPLAEKAAKVGVAHTISGSVRRAGTSVRVQLDLRRARDEALLWSQSYDKELGAGVIAIQSDIADQVARVLQAREQKGAYAGAQFMTANPEAYDLFLKASQTHYSERGVQGRQKTIDGLKQALALDPGFSSAARLLATALIQCYATERNPAKKVRYAGEAKHWAETARRLLPGGAADDALAGYYSQVETDNARALSLAENAIKALPSDAAVLNTLAIALSGAGRSAEAVDYQRQAILLNPENLIYRNNFLANLVRLRRRADYEIAVAEYPAAPRARHVRSVLASLSYRLDGTLPRSLDEFDSEARLNWLQRGWGRTEALPLVESILAEPELDDESRWRAWISKCDVLRRVQRESEAAQAALEAKVWMEELNALPAFDPSERDGRLAVTLARLGNAEEAILAARRYVAASSAENQVRIRRERELQLAEIYAYLGRPRECVELLGKLLQVVSDISVPMLRVDPKWDKMREDAGFKALLADPKNGAPL